jgi:DNA-binding transcriptional LysR family regulator
MMPDIRNLRCVELAAKYGSFRRAAQELGIDPSSVRRQIIAIEDRLRVALFHRSRRGVRLTDTGKEFLERARPAVDQLQQAVDVVSAMKNGHESALSVGIVGSVSSEVVKSILQEHARRYPKIGVKLRRGNPERHREDLMSGRTDIAFLPGRVTVDDCVLTHVLTDLLSVAVPKASPLARRASLRFEDLRDERIIVAGRASGVDLSVFLAQRFEEIGISPTIDVQEIGLEDTLSLVALGWGIAVVPISDQQSHQDIVFRPLINAEKRCPLTIVWRRDQKSRALRAFIESVHAVLGDEKVMPMSEAAMPSEEEQRR